MFIIFDTVLDVQGYNGHIVDINCILRLIVCARVVKSLLLSMLHHRA